MPRQIPRPRLLVRWLARGAALLLVACDHTSPASSNITEQNGSRDALAVSRLTYNVDRDYWPTWTADGNGILYAFVDPPAPRHRCMGILPSNGGERIWQYCDNRASRTDSLVSYPAFALGASGLLYVEVISGRFSSTILAAPQLATITLWLGDTASLVSNGRRGAAPVSLLTLPISTPAGTISWISSLAWVSPSDFVASGRTAETAPSTCHCGSDSGFVAKILLHGHIAGNTVQWQDISGSENVGYFALSADRLKVIFVASGHLMASELATGVTTVLAPGNFSGVQGISCWATACLLSHGTSLTTVLLSSGLESTVYEAPDGQVTLAARSPLSGDVVAQVGGPSGLDGMGPGSPGGDLYLLRAVVP